jgi:nitroreductase/dihydropteridine reductase
MSFLNNLTWRRAVKSFVPPSHDHPSPDIEPILRAAIEAPSSYGLQPWKLIVVTKPDIKNALLPYAYNQRQVTECSHLLIFCCRKDFDDRISEYVGSTSTNPDQAKATAEAITNMIASQAHPTQWAKHQVYLALGFALAAATELKIASCPMEGFSAEGFSSVLDLPHTIIPTVLLAVGIQNPSVPDFPRFRFPRSDLIYEATEDSTHALVIVPKTKYRNVTPVRKRKDKEKEV